MLSINISTPRSGFQIILLKSNTSRAPGSPPSEPALCSQFDGSDRFALVTSVGWWKADQWPECNFKRMVWRTLHVFPPGLWSTAHSQHSARLALTDSTISRGRRRERWEMQILGSNSFLLSLNKLFVCAKMDNLIVTSVCRPGADMTGDEIISNCRRW